MAAAGGLFLYCDASVWHSENGHKLFLSVVYVSTFISLAFIYSHSHFVQENSEEQYAYKNNVHTLGHRQWEDKTCEDLVGVVILAYGQCSCLIRQGCYAAKIRSLLVAQSQIKKCLICILQIILKSYEKYTCFIFSFLELISQFPFSHYKNSFHVYGKSS